MSRKEHKEALRAKRDQQAARAATNARRPRRIAGYAMAGIAALLGVAAVITGSDLQRALLISVPFLFFAFLVVRRGLFVVAALPFCDRSSWTVAPSKSRAWRTPT